MNEPISLKSETLRTKVKVGDSTKIYARVKLAGVFMEKRFLAKYPGWFHILANDLIKAVVPLSNAVFRPKWGGVFADLSDKNIILERGDDLFIEYIPVKDERMDEIIELVVEEP